MEGMDFTSFLQAAVKGVPLLFVVFGLVEWAKRLTKPDGSQLITGNGLLVLSLFLGLFFGSGFMVMSERPPLSLDWYVLFVYWFGVGVYGLAIGLVASGLYDLIKGLITQLVTRAVNQTYRGNIGGEY
jgi:ABC-type polysaccharide/polyol phosphate export permease